MTVCTQQVQAAEADEAAREAVKWVRLPDDTFLGDTRLRAVRQLLHEIDERGTLRTRTCAFALHALAPFVFLSLPCRGAALFGRHRLPSASDVGALSSRGRIHPSAALICCSQALSGAPTRSGTLCPVANLIVLISRSAPLMLVSQFPRCIPQGMQPGALPRRVGGAPHGHHD